MSCFLVFKICHSFAKQHFCCKQMFFVAKLQLFVKQLQHFANNCNILQTKEWGERPMLLKVRRCTFELERPYFGYHFHLWWPVFLSLFSSSKALTSIGRSMYLTVKLRCKQKCQDFQTPFISTAVRLVKPTDILTLQTNKSALEPCKDISLIIGRFVVSNL